MFIYPGLDEAGSTHLEAHHGEDVSDVFSRNGPVLIGETVEATFQHVHLQSNCYVVVGNVTNRKAISASSREFVSFATP